MLKQFLKDGAVYGLSSFVSRGIGLILLPVYTRALTPDEYGIVDMLHVVRAFVVMTVALEVGQGLVRFLPDASSEREKRELVSSATWFAVGMYGLFGVVAVIGARPLSVWLLGSAGAVGAFRLAVCYIVLAGLGALAQNQLRFDLKPRAYAVSAIANLAVVALTTMVFLIVAGMRVEGVFLALIAGSAVGLAASVYAARERYALVFSWQRCREMLSFSAPLVPSGAATFVSNFIDRVAIRQLMTVRDVGLYGVGFRFASATSLLMVGLQMALIPLIYHRYTEASTPREIARIFRLVMVILTPLVMALGVFAPELIATVTTRDYLPAAGVVPLLAASVVLSQFWIFAPGLGLRKRTRTIALLNVAAALVNTGLNYLFIPLWGIMGAAVATLAGSAFTAAGYFVLGARHYPVPHRWLRISVATGFGVAGLVVSAVLWGGTPAASPLVWLEKTALCVVALLLVMAALVDPQEIYRVRSRFVGRLRTT
jgi:O-antigen/teichoic acid export membrane protein